MRRLTFMPFLLLGATLTAMPAAADPVSLSGQGQGSAIIGAQSAASGWVQPAADTFFWVLAPGSRAWSPICPCEGAAIASMPTATAGGGGSLSGAGYTSLAASGTLSLDVKSSTLVRKSSKPHYGTFGTTAVWNNGNGNVLFSHGLAGLGSPRFDPDARMLVPGLSTKFGNESGSPVPEPATLLLLGVGLGTAGWRRLRKKVATA